jgi:ADP-sugar diphosphatase
MSVSANKSAEAESAKRGSSFNLTQILGYQLDSAIPVYLPHNLTKDEFHSLVPGSGSDPAFTFQALQNWLTKLFRNFALQNNANHPFREHPYKLRELDVQAVVWFRETSPEKEGKLGFMKIQAKIETDPYIHGEEKDERPDWLPGAVFLRGGSIAILVRTPPLPPPQNEITY